MKKIIQICANWSANQVEILRQYGIVTEEGCNSIFIEEEKLSENVYSLLKEWRVMLAKGVEFSKKEILQSEYCIIDSCNSFGYPKPDGDFGYRELTYLMTNYCETCGISKIQKDAFRISKISKAKLWSLEWIYDEIFVDFFLSFRRQIVFRYGRVDYRLAYGFVGGFADGYCRACFFYRVLDGRWCRSLFLAFSARVAEQRLLGNA